MKALLIIILLFLGNYVGCFGQQWESVGEPFSGSGYDMVTFEGKLWTFGRVNNVQSKMVYWDDENWNNTPFFLGAPTPLTIESFNDSLFVSGDFVGSNGSPTYLYVWSDNAWVRHSGNFSGASWNSIKKLMSFQDHLFAAGSFESIGNSTFKYIAKWDGLSWSNVAGGVNQLVYDMDVFQNNLLIWHNTKDTIQFNDTITYTVNRKKFQILEDENWNDLDSVFEYADVYFYGVANDKIYFSTEDTISNVVYNHLGSWDGNIFENVEESLFNRVDKVYQFKNELYVAGRTTWLNPLSAQSVIQKKVNDEWILVSEIFDNRILKFHEHNNQLYVSGFFDTYSDSVTNCVMVLIEGEGDNQIDNYNEIVLYPNPTAKEFNLSARDKTILSVEIISYDGKLVKSYKDINNSQSIFNVEDISSGLYFLKILLESNVSKVEKIVIY